MSNPNIARRTELALYFKGVNISGDLTPYLQDMSYTDNEEEKTDDISLTIDDREGVWMNNWLNTKNEDKTQRAFKGTEIHPVIVQKNLFTDGKDRVHDCGTFEIDSVDYSGPPAKITIKATSIPYTSTLRQTKKNKVWENCTIEYIGKTIAETDGFGFMYLSTAKTKYARKEQVDRSDIEFLQSLCTSAGISLKVTSKMIVMFDAAEYEAKDPVKTIKAGRGNIINYKFNSKTANADYYACTVSYTDTNGNEIEGTYTAKSKTEETQELKITQKVSSKAEAVELAKKYLRARNRGETTASFTLYGDVELCAGITVQVYGYGEFSGKYIIEQATHSITGGYTTSIKLRSCLEDY